MVRLDFFWSENRGPRRDSRGRFIPKAAKKLTDELPALLFRNMHDAFTVIGEMHQNEITSMHREPPSIGGRKPTFANLSRISGSLIDSQRTVVTPSRAGTAQDLDALRLRRAIGVGLPYPKVHELGTIGAGGSLPDIRPKSAKVLAIPLPGARTPGGDVRGGPRLFSGFWRKVARTGNLIFFSQDTMEPLFYGVGPGLPQESVAIPARLRFIATMRRLLPQARAIMVRATGRALVGQRLGAG